LEEVLHNPDQIKSDIKGVNTKTAKLTTRVRKIKDQIKPITDDIASIKSTMEDRKHKVHCTTDLVMIQCQYLATRMIKAWEHVTIRLRYASTNTHNI